MRSILFFLIASIGAATPALADTRVELRGGAISANGATQDITGAAAGIDFDLTPLTFAGVELSGDKIGDTGAKTVWAVTGRVGARLPTGTRLYGLAGYGTEACDRCDRQWQAGAGLQQSMFGPLYIKAEYRHRFANQVLAPSDTILAGAGVSF